jgi:outer membrane lipoprotein-sorting protein
MNHSFKSFLSPAALLLAAALLICPGCGKKNTAPTTPASMEELNRALTVVMMHNGQQLPSTNEVAAFLERTGKVFPAAPPGKQIILNPTAREFEVVDQ